jgi:UDP-3-O-[3-hydroxymyristoyl] glucosamine N-acyltransferase
VKTRQIASLLGGELRGDSAREIRGVASLQAARPDELTFAEGVKAAQRAAASSAGCILVQVGVTLPGKTTVMVAEPRLAFVHAAEALCPPAALAPGVHPTAIIAPDAELPADVSVGAHVVVESHAVVGAGTRLGVGVFLGEGVQIGAKCILHPRVTIYSGSRVGDRVILHSGVVVGSDGFGYVFAEGRYMKFPQLGQVIIGDDVEIGSNSTLDRGSLGTTVIGEGTKIDNLVQIAHNVRIGRHCVIAAQSGISGSAEVGDYVVLAGQVGVGDHARIEDRAVVGGQAGILPAKVVRKGAIVWGTPSRPLTDFKRQYALLSNLPKLAEKVQNLWRASKAVRDR